MSARLTKTQLARMLACRDADAYHVADAWGGIGIPFRWHHGIKADGSQHTERRYRRDDVVDFLAAVAVAQVQRGAA